MENINGVRIKKCCASCAFKKTTTTIDTRKCCLTGEEHDHSDVCENWKINVSMSQLRLRKKS